MANNQGRCELNLMASPGAWRLYSARKADSRFKSFELYIQSLKLVIIIMEAAGNNYY